MSNQNQAIEKPLIPALKKGWEKFTSVKKTELIKQLVDQISNADLRVRSLQESMEEVKDRMSNLRETEKAIISKKNQMHHFVVAMLTSNTGLVKLSNSEILERAEYLCDKLDEPLAKFYAEAK